MKIRKKFLSLSAPARASMAFLIANIFQKGLNFLTAPINTRILSTKDYGTISLYDSWYAMLSVFAMLSLYEAVFGVGMTDFKEDRDVFSFSMLALSNIATAMCAVVYYLFPGQVQKILGMNNKLIILMLVSFWFYPSLYFWTIKQRFEYKYKASVTVTMLTSFFMSLCSIVAVMMVKENKAEIKILVNFIVILPVLVILYLLIMLNSKFTIKVKYWWYALKFNIPLLPHYVAMYLLASSDRVMIAKYINEAETGVYDIACKFNSILGVIISAINASFTPWTYECLANKKYKELRRVSTMVLFAIGILCTGVSLVVPEAVKIIATSEYQRAVYAVPALSIGMYFSATYFMISNVEFYHKSTVFSMVATIISASVNIGLNAVLLPRFGFCVAAYTTCFCYFMQAVLHYFNMRRVEKEKVYNMKFIFGYSIFIIVTNLALMKVYNNYYVRYGIVLFIILFALIKRKMIIRTLKQIKNKEKNSEQDSEYETDEEQDKYVVEGKDITKFLESNNKNYSKDKEKYIAGKKALIDKTDSVDTEKCFINGSKNRSTESSAKDYLEQSNNNKDFTKYSDVINKNEKDIDLEEDVYEIKEYVNVKEENDKNRKKQKKTKEYIDDEDVNIKVITADKINMKKLYKGKKR